MSFVVRIVLYAGELFRLTFMTLGSDSIIILLVSTLYLYLHIKLDRCVALVASLHCRY